MFRIKILIECAEPEAELNVFRIGRNIEIRYADPVIGRERTGRAV